MSLQETNAGSVPGKRFQTPARGNRFTLTETMDLIQADADWIWETDAELRISWLSDNYEKVTGIDPASVLGHFPFDFLKHSTRTTDRAAQHLDDLQARRPFRDFVSELQGMPPECRLISVTGLPLFDEDGTFKGYRGITRNVTAMAEAIADLDGPTPAAADPQMIADQSHAPDPKLLLSALDAISDACCLYDADDRLIICNEATREIYKGIADVIRPGISFAEIIEAGIERGLWDPNDRSPDEWRELLRARIGGPIVSSVTFKFADGRVILHREAPTENGGRMGICTDITEQEQSAFRLASADKQSRRLLFDLERTIDAMTMGVVLLDDDLNVEIINPAFREIWGSNREKSRLVVPSAR